MQCLVDGLPNLHSFALRDPVPRDFDPATHIWAWLGSLESLKIEGVLFCSSLSFTFSGARRSWQILSVLVYTT
jgi:hypothetical protein